MKIPPKANQVWRAGLATSIPVALQRFGSGGLVPARRFQSPGNVPHGNVSRSTADCRCTPTPEPKHQRRKKGACTSNKGNPKKRSISTASHATSLGHWGTQQVRCLAPPAFWKPCHQLCAEGLLSSVAASPASTVAPHFLLSVPVPSPNSPCTL